MEEKSTVFVVDDDIAMRESIGFALSQAGLCVEVFASGEEFLMRLGREARGCIILDLRMPGMSGSELHAKLVARKLHLPVIILTGHGDVPTAVEEMKRGAFDFLSKPVKRDVLLTRGAEAIALDAARCQAGTETVDIMRRIETLSPRELEVMDQVALGQANKQIAYQLKLSELTVANHRAHILRKMGAVNSADLVRQLGLIHRLGGRMSRP